MLNHNLTPTQEKHIKILKDLNRVLLAEIDILNSYGFDVFSVSIKAKLLDIEVHNEVIKKIESGELDLEEEKLEIDSIKFKGGN